MKKNEGCIDNPKAYGGNFFFGGGEGGDRERERCNNFSADLTHPCWRSLFYEIANQGHRKGIDDHEI